MYFFYIYHSFSGVLRELFKTQTLNRNLVVEYAKWFMFMLKQMLLETQIRDVSSVGASSSPRESVLHTKCKNV